LRDDVDQALAAADIDAMSTRIDEHIIGIAACFEDRQPLAGRGVEVRKARRGTKCDHQTVCIDIQRHRVVSVRAGERGAAEAVGH